MLYKIEDSRLTAVLSGKWYSYTTASEVSFTPSLPSADVSHQPCATLIK